MIKKLLVKNSMSNTGFITRFSFSKTSILFLMVYCFFLIGLSSCKNKQKIVLNNGKCILDYKNAKTLTTNLKANEFRFNRLTAKLSVESLIDSSSNSFTINLKMKKDSVIWMSISKFGIEGARVLITRDTVKLTISFGDKKYFIGDFSYISKLLNADLDFEILQSLFVGNSVAFYDEDSKLKPGSSNCQYTLGTIRKRKLRRVMEKGKELKESAQSIYMLPESFKISRILFYEFNPERSLDVQYSEHTKVDSTQFLPLKMNLVFRAKKNISIAINYTKTSLDQEQTFLFKIPEGYEQIIYDEKK